MALRCSRKTSIKCIFHGLNCSSIAFYAFRKRFSCNFFTLFFFFIKRIFVSCLQGASTSPGPHSTYTGYLHFKTLVFYIYRWTVETIETHAGMYLITCARWRQNEYILLLFDGNDVHVLKSTRFMNSIVNVQQLLINTINPFVDRLIESVRTTADFRRYRSIRQQTAADPGPADRSNRFK